ncbi:hypothetical protein ACFWPQ_42275, partial [Streptomyces sp. NPDC058464]
GIFHPYYTTQLAPAIAALCGGGFVLLARLHRGGVRWAPMAAAVAVAATVIWSAVVIRRNPDWHGWLAWPVLLAGCAAVVLLFLIRRGGRLVPAAALAAVLAVLLAPGAWAVSKTGSSTEGMGGTNPTAGPMTSMFGGGGMPGRGSGGGAGQPGGQSGMPSGMPTGMSGFPGAGSGSGQSGGFPSGDMPSGMPTSGTSGGQGMPSIPGGGSGSQGMPSFPGGETGGQGETPSFPGGSAGRSGGGGGGGFGGFGGSTKLTSEQRKILDYAVKHAPKARIKLAVASNAQAAAPFILDSDETVIGMGGFSGTDNAPSVDQLKNWTKTGELRYVLGTDSKAGAGAGFPGMGGDGVAQQRSEWITKNCTKVPASAYGGSSKTSGASAFGGATVLYDCAAG